MNRMFVTSHLQVCLCFTSLIGIKQEAAKQQPITVTIVIVLKKICIDGSLNTHANHNRGS